MKHSQVLDKLKKIEILLGDLSVSRIQGVPTVVLSIRYKLVEIEKLSKKYNSDVGDN